MWYVEIIPTFRAFCAHDHYIHFHWKLHHNWQCQGIWKVRCHSIEVSLLVYDWKPIQMIHYSVIDLYRLFYVQLIGMKSLVRYSQSLVEVQLLCTVVDYSTREAFLGIMCLQWWIHLYHCSYLFFERMLYNKTTVSWVLYFVLHTLLFYFFRVFNCHHHQIHTVPLN